MKYSSLSREQEKKKVFLQLGTKFSLPRDLIISLYRTLETLHKNKRDLHITFYNNIHSLNLYEPYSNFGLNGYSCNINEDYMFTSNPFSYRIPINRGIEWTISAEIEHFEHILFEGFWDQLTPRNILLHQIKILGDKNFMMKEDIIIRGRQFYECLTNKERIKFINNQGVDLFLVYEDYSTIQDGHPHNIVVYNEENYMDVWLDVELLDGIWR
tara:strand:- start:266 stop:904 length:639 start_codon:yes stop_codon:yes gene_type:complete